MKTQVARDPRSADLMSLATALQKRHEAGTTLGSRKAKGQVFTPVEVCRYMAGLLDRVPNRVRLLDPGAGVGALTAAFCERVLTLPSPRKLHATLYESDAALLPLLDENLRHCRAALAAVGHELTFSIRDQDFVLSGRGNGEQRMLFDQDEPEDEFDAVLMNPPYFKIGSDSAHALAMKDVFQGQTNIYMMFMARAAGMLRPEGEMVAITPRSYCNGPYFKHFRRWFFSRMALRHVHLFECRRGTFEDVLQEGLITLTSRLGAKRSTISITTSFDKHIPAKLEAVEMPAATILDDSSEDLVLRIPISVKDAAILRLVEAWPDRFAQLGLRISTGPVVPFRTREFLLDSRDGGNYAPLLGMHNVKAFETTWPVERRGRPTAFQVCRESQRHLVPARNYVLLRRFSAKEERRRLTASGFFRDGAIAPYLALENHLNYIYHADRELSTDEVHGLTTLFNSVLLDRYFRIISGNTQVNATEIRAIPFPPLDRVAAIGRRTQRLVGLDPNTIDRIVLEEFAIHGELAEYLTGSTP